MNLYELIEKRREVTELMGEVIKIEARLEENDARFEQMVLESAALFKAVSEDDGSNPSYSISLGIMLRNVNAEATEILETQSKLNDQLRHYVSEVERLQKALDEHKASLEEEER